MCAFFVSCALCGVHNRRAVRSDIRVATAVTPIGTHTVRTSFSCANLVEALVAFTTRLHDEQNAAGRQH